LRQAACYREGTSEVLLVVVRLVEKRCGRSGQNRRREEGVQVLQGLRLLLVHLLLVRLLHDLPLLHMLRLHRCY
jgi:hypothetical protein